MFSNGPPFPTLTSHEDSNPANPDPRSVLSRIMLSLAKKRNGDQGAAADQAAGFREGERAPVAGASI